MVAGQCRITSSVFVTDRTKVTIGHGCTLTGSCYIDCEEFVLGDYCTLHSVTAHGKSVRLGHNCWVGQGTILDGLGGLTIGNNVGIGAYSQLYTHGKFGDTLFGCRHKTEWSTRIGNDAWLLPRVLSSARYIGERAMVLGGSVLTRDVPYDQTWGGYPAKDLTKKLGPQFTPTTSEQRVARFLALVHEYRATGREVDVGRFYPASRSYLPSYSPRETEFVRWMLYDKAKFTPAPS